MLIETLSKRREIGQKINTESREAGKFRHSGPPLPPVFPFLNFITWARAVRRLKAALQFHFIPVVNNYSHRAFQFLAVGKSLASEVFLNL